MDDLTTLLEEARTRRLLGPGPVRDHVQHAERLVAALPESGVGVDLGTGGGVPGVALALRRPQMRWILIECQQRRAAWLDEVVRRLGLGGRVAVRPERAECSGRGSLRGTVDVVTARSFGAPAVVAECAAPLLREGGKLWVSEPPSPSAGRWNHEGLAVLGLRSLAADTVRSWGGFELVTACPARYPRRPGMPERRPLF